MAYIKNKFLNLEDLIGLNRNATTDSASIIKKDLDAQNRTIDTQKDALASQIGNEVSFNKDQETNNLNNKVNFGEPLLSDNESNEIKNRLTQTGTYTGPSVNAVDIKVEPKRPMQLAQLLGSAGGQDEVNRQLFGQGKGYSAGQARFDRMLQNKDTTFLKNRNDALSLGNSLENKAQDANVALTQKIGSVKNSKDKFNQDYRNYYENYRTNVLRQQFPGLDPNRTMDYNTLSNAIISQMKTQQLGNAGTVQQIKQLLNTNKVTPELLSFLTQQGVQYNPNDTNFLGTNVSLYNTNPLNYFSEIGSDSNLNLAKLIGSKGDVSKLRGVQNILGETKNIDVNDTGKYTEKGYSFDKDKFLKDAKYNYGFNTEKIFRDDGSITVPGNSQGGGVIPVNDTPAGLDTGIYYTPSQVSQLYNEAVQKRDYNRATQLGLALNKWFENNGSKQLVNVKF